MSISRPAGNKHHIGLLNKNMCQSLIINKIERSHGV